MKRYGSELIFCERDEWGLIEVVENTEMRALHFGSPVEQSAYYFHAPFTFAHEYQEVLFDQILNWAEDYPVGELLLLGLGGGSLVSQLHPCFPDTKMTAVELRQTVIDVAYQFFHLPQSPLIQCVAEDANLFVIQAKQRYDVIIVDLYDEHGMPPDFTTEAFQRALQKLFAQPHSLLLINLWQTTPKACLPVLHYWEDWVQQMPNAQLKTHAIASSQNLILEVRNC